MLPVSTMMAGSKRSRDSRLNRQDTRMTFQIACLLAIALYLGVGIGLCMMLRSEKAPGHWTNYLMLTFGWPIVILISTRSNR